MYFNYLCQQNDFAYQVFRHKFLLINIHINKLTSFILYLLSCSKVRLRCNTISLPIVVIYQITMYMLIKCIYIKQLLFKITIEDRLFFHHLFFMAKRKLLGYLRYNVHSKKLGHMQNWLLRDVHYTLSLYSPYYWLLNTNNYPNHFLNNHGKHQ